MTEIALDDVARGDQVDCAIIIVTYNSAQYIGSLLDSLSDAAPGVTVRVVVVDNGSTDDTVKLVRQRPEILCVDTGLNLGYAGGINVGRTCVGDCRAIAVLNPDLVVEPDAICALLAALADPAVGVVVPRLLDPDGTPYPSLRREPTLTRAVGDALFGDRLGRRPGFLSESVRDAAAYDHRHPVDWAGGAAWMISAACDTAVGDWDERFFLYMEEVDFATQVRAAGLRIDYVPKARVRHRGGGYGRSAVLTALMAVHRVRYYRKYHGPAATAVYRCVVILHYCLRATSAEARVVLATLANRARWQDLPRGDLDAPRTDHVRAAL